MKKINLKKLSKIEWHIEHVDACPAFTEMAGFHFTRRLCRPIPAYKITLGFYKNKEADWMTLASDQQKIGKSIIRAFLKNKKFLDNYCGKWTSNFDLMRNFYYRKFEENVKSLADDELWKWAEDVYNFYRKKISFPAFIDGFMFYADKRLNFLVREFCEEKKMSNHPKIFSVLSTPIEPSFIYEEGRELEKIVNTMVKSGLKKQNLKIFLKNRKNKKFFNLIHNHLLKYSWIKSSYAGYKQYAINDVQNEVNKITEENRQKETWNIFYQNQLAKKQLIKKHKFTPEIAAIAKITEKFTRWQDQRKVYTLTFVALQEKILREISRRAGINLELLRYCRISDLSRVLRRKFNGKELKNRQKSSLFVYEEGRIANIFIGKKAKKFFKEASEIKTKKEVKEIKGMTASLGKARGAAKVVKTAKYISKIKEGDILVAPMTRPEYLAGVKRAAAIITDDGGITCHAAIISRELHKPCIIGTKVATKVLKDGDIIEVDANRGIIKIIE